MDSYNRKYPIHSDTMMSTLSTGRSTSSTLPRMSVTLSCVQGQEQVRRGLCVRNKGTLRKAYREAVGFHNDFGLLNDG